MARPRKPTAMLELSGTLKDHPARYANRVTEPKSDQPLGSPPRRLTDDQKKLWKELVLQVVPGVLTAQDRWHMELACRLMEKVIKGEARVAEQALLANMLGKIGLNPSDRSKVSVTPQKKERQEESWADFAANDDEVVTQ